MLDQNRLKTSLKATFTDVSWSELEQVEALDLFCGKLAKAIIDEVKNASINYTTGLTAGSTPVTGTFNNTIS